MRCNGKRGEIPPLPRNCESAYAPKSDTGFIAQRIRTPRGVQGEKMLNVFSRRLTGRCARVCVSFGVLLTVLDAHAVIVRGRVCDSLNRPVANAPVQLVQNGQVVATTMSMADGSYEIRGAASGRFMVQSGSAGFAPYYSKPFYAGDLDVVAAPVTLVPVAASETVTVTATGLPTPIEQVSASVHVIDKDEILTQVDLVQELRLQPGVQVVQAGQNGSQTSLFVRGANSDANKVLIDGVPSNDVGGVFNFGNVASTAISNMEVHRGPDSVLYGSDALGSVVSINTPRGMTSRPIVHYSGSAGNFHTWDNEVELSGARRKADYYAAFSRFDSSNALQMDRFHVATAAANVGYSLTGNTQLRGTVRNAVSATGVPNAHDFYGISAVAKQGDQDTFFTGVLENTYKANWHNVVRYYGARKREQYQEFYSAGEYLFGAYYGNTVTIRGANGYTATGRASISYPSLYAQSWTASNRDGVNYNSDYRFGQHLSALLGFRYEDERGASVNPNYGTNQKAERRNYDYNLQLQGDIKGRVFYTLGGAIQKNYLFGTEGTPRLGIAWYPIRPGIGWLRGTKVHFNFSKGVQEPSLAAQNGSLYGVLQQNNTSSPLVYPIEAERSRTYEGGVDQHIYGTSLVLHFNYFHNQFDKALEYVTSNDIYNYFGVGQPCQYCGGYINSLAFKAQGVESEIEWHPLRRLMLRGGYTYTDAIVERSYASDVILALSGTPTENPNLPGIAIGATSPLIGQRPFRRPPQLGYLVGYYAFKKISISAKASFASRSDDSTFIDKYSSLSFDNTMLLPNRNLDFAYQRVDASIRWQWKPSLMFFTQLNNILGQQHMGPIGYPALPFNFRSGLNFRFGHS